MYHISACSTFVHRGLKHSKYNDFSIRDLLSNVPQSGSLGVQRFRLISSSNYLFCLVQVAKTASGRTLAIEYWAMKTQWVNYLPFLNCTAMYQRYAVKLCHSCLQQFPLSTCLYALIWHQPQRHVHAPYRHQILVGGNTFG